MLLHLAAVSLMLSSVAAMETVYLERLPEAKCHETESLCGDGCCPFSNATCCDQTPTCCRAGAICLESLGMCLGIRKDEPSLYSERITELRKDGSGCPKGETLCLGRCCAVCCRTTAFGPSYCCPRGNICSPFGCIGDRKKLPKRYHNSDGSRSSLPGTMPVPASQKYLTAPKSGALSNCCFTILFYHLWWCCKDYETCTFYGCIP